ncbi:helix-turn-helix transcriptional regulator [Aquimarina megaterium]|uniref:helix-turn-helix transcriptional regulator n=1 Tax=Aquimarina megaterium TaxID=1443666 RepID=UPI000470ADC0|nr:hypothetical protein [Aquimarina megaterium]
MIESLLAFTVTVLVIALVIIGYLQYKNYKYRIDVKRVKHDNLILDQKLAIKEEEIKELLFDKNQQLLLNENIIRKLKSEVITTNTSEEAQKLCLLTAQLQFQIAYEKRLTTALQKTTDINQSFESKLEILYPELTPHEREVCTLFSLQLSMKEIMKIRNLSLNAIQLIRKQIREKMNIPIEIELEKFIRELA